MSNNELNLLSKKIKKEADLLLNKSGLVNFLSKYGEVHIRGSYELDLMLDGDIDIYVINKRNNKNTILKIFNRLIVEAKFDGYIFYDFYKKTRKYFPKGYYVGLKTRYNKRKWKIDIWFMKKMDKRSDDLINYVKARLNNKNRGQILKLKSYCKNKNLNISSHLVYLAVIRHGITTIKDLKKNLDKI
jgi:hypothetical protein